MDLPIFLDCIGHPIAVVCRKPVDARHPPMQVLWPVDQTDLVEQISYLAEQYNAVYCNLNPLRPQYLEVRPKQGVSIRDVMIARRTRFLIDIDAHDIPKSEAEQQKDAIKEHLGWPVLLETDSGNGYGLIYECDLPTDRESHTLIKHFLKGLKSQFPCVDITCSNAGRLTRLIGTWNVRDGVRIPTRILNYGQQSTARAEDTEENAEGCEAA